ncbi:MAG: hypothetical protein WBQ86_22400 [Candidatus Binatus sp.]
MSSHSNAKDRSDIPTETAEAAPIAGERASAEWPRLLARIVEGIVSAELHQFEENVMAFLNSAVEDAYASFLWLCARVVGVCFLLTAMILLLGIFLAWWAVFALVGAVVIAAASRLGTKHNRLI